MKDLEIIKTTVVKEKCPAFQEGCPFAKLVDHQLTIVEKCPEFQHGCPFKDAKSLGEVYEKLSHVPHSSGSKSELSDQKLIEIFKKMHDTSDCLEEKLGDCPVFHEDGGCPFKNACPEDGKRLVEPAKSVSHDQHVMEKLKGFDATHLQDQCPAFKDGCPFAKIEVEDMKNSVQKCPEFQSGCPFKGAKNLADVYEKLSHVPHAAGHESEVSGQKLIEMLQKLLDTSECFEKELGDCPIFHKGQGCPFKSIRTEEGKHLVEPVESIGQDQHVLKDLRSVDATHLQDQCPAFQDGCPFARIDDQDMKAPVEKCPEFKNGCPFKDAKNLGDVYEKLSHVPHSSGDESELPGQKLVDMLKKVHDTSESLEGKLGDCPVFHKDHGCPFKSVRSNDGKHLVRPASSVISHVQEKFHVSLPNSKVMTTRVSNIQETCPAFQPSCPFSDIASKSDAFKNAMNCPAFKDGCAFKECKSVNDIYQKLKDIPNVDEESGSHGDIVENLKIVHGLCVELKAAIGECPVFKTEDGCPFKTICSDGNLMVEEIERNIASRILGEAAEEAKQRLEEELLTSSGVSLSSELKQGTKKLHRLASNAYFVKQLIKGKASPAVYKLYLSNLYFLYSVLEEEGEKHKSHPMLQPMYFPDQLQRTPEIIKDLEFFYGPDWKDEIEPICTTQRYVLRLRELSEKDPMLLVAHQYTRYLGDLAGGQVLKKAFSKAYNLWDGDGVHFYEFKNIANVKEFKELYRKKLDSLQLDKKTADRMVQESKESFELNIEFFNELGALCGIEPGPMEDHTEPKFSVSVPEDVESKPSQKGLFVQENGGQVAQHVHSLNGDILVVFGMGVALFAILYSYLLA